MTIDAFENKATRLRQLALQAAAATGAEGDTAQDIAQETMLRLWQMRDDPRLYNPEGYAKTSLIDKAKDLKGKLQIITGYNDNTVVPQHCLSFLDACIKAGTQPDFFAYPGEEHNMRGHASVHLHERITQYFEDYLKVKR